MRLPFRHTLMDRDFCLIAHFEPRRAFRSFVATDGYFCSVTKIDDECLPFALSNSRDAHRGLVAIMPEWSHFAAAVVAVNVPVIRVASPHFQKQSRAADHTHSRWSFSHKSKDRRQRSPGQGNVQSAHGSVNGGGQRSYGLHSHTVPKRWKNVQSNHQGLTNGPTSAKSLQCLAGLTFARLALETAHCRQAF